MRPVLLVLTLALAAPTVLADDAGRGLPSGIYVCRLQVPERVEAIRMVLAR